MKARVWNREHKKILYILNFMGTGEHAKFEVSKGTCNPCEGLNAFE